MMRRQRSPCTLSSFGNLSHWQIPSTASCNYELYPNSLYTQFLTTDSDQRPNSYQGTVYYDYSAGGDSIAENNYLQDTNAAQTIADESYMTYDDSWSFTETSPLPEQSAQDSYSLPIDYGIQNFAEEPFQQCVLQYGMPTVTDYGTISLLVRHLIRIDTTIDGSVSVHNFPARSVISSNVVTNKSYVEHPNGRVLQEGPVIHVTTGNARMAKIFRRGIAFSSALQSLAYFVDESGTKTATAKFRALNNELTMDVFYEGNCRTYEDVEQECYRMASESTYRSYPDGSELWALGRIRVKQDRWGQVTVVQNDGRRTISTSPTIRKVAIESQSFSINIDCYSMNYLTVRKDPCIVTSGYCGLIAQNRSQKAGLDRNGRLVLF